jgi:hypothetical protein
MAMMALLLAALIAVESGGRTHAVGDGGKAVGVLQIHPITVRDVNRIAGTSYQLSDRLCPAKSRAMATIYLNHYASAKRLGREPRLEDMARMWNGGPNGHRKTATLGYWAKVQRAMRN